MEEMACGLIKTLTEIYPGALQERYGLSELGSPLSVLEGIAESRKCYSKGEALDFGKAANILIDDFRSGKLGRITLERP